MNRILEDMLRHYVKPSQEDWDEHLDMAEFAINNSYQASIKMAPAQLVYGKRLPTPVTLAKVQGSSNPASDKFITDLQALLKEAKQNLNDARSRQQNQADKHRRHVEFAELDKVLLSSKNISLRGVGTPKLMPKWLGPFKVLRKVGPVAYKLELPETARIHDVFHVSLLKPYRSDGSVQPPDPHYIMGGEEYEVEEILTHRMRKFGRAKHETQEFLIKWLGYGPEHNTWEPESNVMNAPEKLAEYWAAVRSRNLPVSTGRRRVSKR